MLIYGIFTANLLDKGCRTTIYHLGADYTYHENGELSWGSKTYIEKILSSFERMFEGERLSTRITCPLEPGDHPELDLTDFLEGNSITTYQSLIGMLQWAITIGRIDIQQAVMTMSRFSHKPRKGHLNRVKRIFSYLKRFESA